MVQFAGILKEVFEQDCQAILQSWSRRLEQDCQAILQSWSRKGKLVGEQVGHGGGGGAHDCQQSCNLGLQKGKLD